MGSGSSGGRRRSAEFVSQSVTTAQAEIATATFESALANYLSDLLTSINARNTGLVSERLGEIRTALEQETEETIDHLFGGSVAKRTYIEGLSDIDSVLVLNNTNLADSGPQTALEQITDALGDRLKGAVSVTHGQLAVTVEYPDGMQIQLLPSIRLGDRLRIPSSSGDRWSEIEPTGFREALTNANESCGGRLIPTIKLAKTIISSFPEVQRLSGYHVESLAVAAFREYDGPKTTSAMLPAFFERAAAGHRADTGSHWAVFAR